ncbi:hypothetical protein OOT46_22855 [Aquabacterium sp. A7-Y]|uniref:hypothetical protein n=1 Tax=Aquabacterium sp. A7-Y TaxID=1349605 RepID=UPI00223D78DE|nr:hypothetical protein [Aquabacterium sp. A7-Y]MCW7540663.1 hypothetical protein [Aquabacterium sp. A7-Y]
MKLNPFTKKNTGGYYAKVKAEYEQLSRELAEAKQQLPLAQADFDEKNRLLRAAEARSSRFTASDEEQAARSACHGAKEVLSQLEWRIRELDSTVTPLGWVVHAPGKLETARQTIKQLKQRRASLEGDLEKTGRVIDKVEKRAEQLRQRIADETVSASQAIADAEGEIAMPDSLMRLESELRVTETALGDQKRKAEELQRELQAIPKQLNDARSSFQHSRADVADIELREQLHLLMNSIARATAAAHESLYSRPDNKYEIEVPHEYVTAAKEQLDAELSAL